MLLQISHPSLPRRFLSTPISPQFHDSVTTTDDETPVDSAIAAAAELEINLNFDEIDFQPQLYEPDLFVEHLYSDTSSAEDTYDYAKSWNPNWRLSCGVGIKRTNSWNFMTKLKNYFGVKVSPGQTADSPASSLSLLASSDISFLPVSVRVPISSGCNTDEPENIPEHNDELKIHKNPLRSSHETIKFDSYAHLLIYNSRSKITPPSSILTPVFASTSIRSCSVQALECLDSQSYPHSWTRPFHSVRRTLSRTFTRDTLAQLNRSNSAFYSKSILKSKVNENFVKERELSQKVDTVSLEDFLNQLEQEQALIEAQGPESDFQRHLAEYRLQQLKEYYNK